MYETFSLLLKKDNHWAFYFSLLLISMANQVALAQICPTPADSSLITPCYVNGVHTASTNDDVIVLFNHATARGTSATKQVVTSYSEGGTVGGLAYKLQTKKLYAAAFLKCHRDLSPYGLQYIGILDNIPSNTNLKIKYYIDYELLTLY